MTDDAWRIEPLFVSPATGSRRGGPLTPELARRYGADLSIALRRDRPTIVSNFVTTIDGVVAFDTEGRTGGREVSGGSSPDRFLMGLVRATSDAVMNGAGTVRAGAHGWTPASVHPASADAYAEWRRSLGLAPQPTAVIVTGSGSIDPEHPGLHDPAVPVVVDVLRDRNLGLVACEGGPTLFAGLVEERLIDELFLTIAPQIAGRSDDATRLSLVEGVGFAIADAPWLRLVSAMRADSHLFLRYRKDDSPNGKEGKS